ncbi:hypothetical protein C8F04DRAFT_1174056 [Mycena alexandri]|uniref:Uncharacterized protein n=1 Tax=Mycena alexandri TaxID=1745969 RepID=A0AAD6XEK0_9AGAR|nr:hypothetical protein C8F04DRAFT_1174056 [Mycena alexandri]
MNWHSLFDEFTTCSNNRIYVRKTEFGPEARIWEPDLPERFKNGGIFGCIQLEEAPSEHKGPQVRYLFRAVQNPEEFTQKLQLRDAEFKIHEARHGRREAEKVEGGGSRGGDEEFPDGYWMAMSYELGMRVVISCRDGCPRGQAKGEGNPTNESRRRKGVEEDGFGWKRQDRGNNSIQLALDGLRTSSRTFKQFELGNRSVELCTQAWWRNVQPRIGPERFSSTSSSSDLGWDDAASCFPYIQVPQIMTTFGNLFFRLSLHRVSAFCSTLKFRGYQEQGLHGNNPAR